jgi:multicomponent Na+:H+ antiporter subunit A
MQLILILYLVLSLLVFWLPKRINSIKGILLAMVQFSVLTYFFLKIPYLNRMQILEEGICWVPGLGIDMVFVLDGLSMVFVLLITGIGGMVFLYAQSYMKTYGNPSSFYSYLLLFSCAMLGLVLSANLIQLFIFWELTSFLSFMLISFFHEKDSARSAALQSLLITGFGGLSLLAGILLLGSIIGSYSVNDWISSSDILTNHPLYLPGLLLILVGAFTKSAQFPFHFWLPGAMQAPAPVSSYLHSATMVKAGFFLLARLNPALGATPEWTIIVPTAGVLTMLTGSYFAITRSDIKSILAYTTINALGILILLIGIDTKIAIKASLLFLFVHALYKASLFMIAGLLEKRTGTREIDRLGGLIRYMPVTFAVTTLVALSMAGLPPMLGFIGKELIYEAKAQLPGLGVIVLILGVISNILMVSISLLFVYRIFLGGKGTFETRPHEKGVLLLAGPIFLALLSLLLGLAPSLLGKNLIEAALEVVHPEDFSVKLKLWHGFNQVFFLSLFTVLAGILLFFILKNRQIILAGWRSLNDKLFRINLAESFPRGLAAFVRFSDRKTRLIQHGYHRYYILTIFLFTAILLWIQIYITRGWQLPDGLSIQPLYISGIALVIVLSAIFSTRTRTRIATIIAMGVAGYGISLIYLYYSAVDLAITQILAETLIVIVFVLVIDKLPRFREFSSRKTKIRDYLIALFFGSVMTVVALKAIPVEFNQPVSDFYLENSSPRGFGKNVVNVILVDFRALDTLGEILVLTLAAFGITILVSRTKTNPK